MPQSEVKHRDRGRGAEPRARVANRLWREIIADKAECTRYKGAEGGAGGTGYSL